MLLYEPHLSMTTHAFLYVILLILFFFLITHGHLEAKLQKVYLLDRGDTWRETVTFFTIFFWSTN